jgi:hypothetical protein
VVNTLVLRMAECVISGLEDTKGLSICATMLS